VAGGTLAGAQSSPADDRPHLLVVPHTPEGEAALDRSDARVVARYDEFTLVEAVGGDDTRLRGAGADRRDDMREVSLPAAEFDPRSQRASLAAKGTPDPAETLAVVQFVGPVKDAWLGRLEHTGAQVVQYASQNAYLVHAAGGEVDRLAGLVGTDAAVRAVTPVAADDKVGEQLTSGGPRTMAVQTIAGDAGTGARREAAAAGPRVRAETSVGELRTQFVRIDGAAAAALAEDPGVVSITPWSPPRLLDERAAQVVAGNLLPGGAPSADPSYLDWLAGEGFGAGTINHTIDIADQGLDNGDAVDPAHPDFYENGAMPGTDRVRYARNWTGDPDARDCGGHGTNVASIAAGFGTTGAGRQDDAGFRYGMGVSPRAQVGASKIFDCSGRLGFFGSLEEPTSAAYDGDARISNNSWGFSDSGRYTVDSQEYDALVRDAQPEVIDNQEMVEVFAAGNDGQAGYGSVGSPGTAKNVITVGASEGVRPIRGVDGCGVSDAEADNPNDIIDFSSRGPTDDGRLKPDLVAPGTHVVGARPQHAGYAGGAVCGPFSPPFYTLSSGTSQAAPEVAGAASLVRDWYRREIGGEEVVPSPAMTKAILVNAAADLAGGNNGKGGAIENAPNTDQGWGRVDVGEVFDDSTPRVYRDQLAADRLSASGPGVARGYAVGDEDLPVKVTLAWTDAPGAVGPRPYVNDLDLVVEAGGQTYKGNVFANGHSIPGGSADPRNNLESVFLPAGTDGHFSVRVVATNIAGDGVPGDADLTDQDFALVVSNAGEDASPVLVHQASTINDADGDGLEPGEPFHLNERLRNAGDAPAQGVSGTLSADDLTLTSDLSGWGNIAGGAAATNNTPFEGRLLPGATCGAEVSATLDLSTGAELQSLPLTLPTGTPQSPTVVSRSHSPAVSIPDNNTAGVTSTIQVGNPGRIKDLNVRIGGIAHTAVGDLRIDLTGPDGTTVRLADHPGGPDNQGDNFVNTVVDDEAGANISAGSPPYSGHFRPQNDQLSRFDGKPRQGTWTLRVRDLVGVDTGTLSGWGSETQSAGCDFGGAGPQTTIHSGPPNPSASRGATFQFGSNASGATFECRLDGGDYVECPSSQGYSGLADGSHTLSVRAVDATGNVDTTPASYSWRVSVPPETTTGGGPPETGPPPGAGVDTAAPNFALAPTEEYLSDALTRGVTVLAGCASACKVSATLTMPARKARSLGLRSPRRGGSASAGGFKLGSTTARLQPGSPRSVTLRLPRAAKTALRDESALRAMLSVKIPAGGRTPVLRQPISLTHAAGLRRVVRRGLRLGGICSEGCTLRGRLELSRREARRVGLRARGGGPVTVAAGSARASASRSRLTLKFSGAYRRTLLRTRRSLKPTLEALVRGATGPEEHATRRLVLRR
jgi:subtilisin-like proprotein convertase family protein